MTARTLAAPAAGGLASWGDDGDGENWDDMDQQLGDGETQQDTNNINMADYQETDSQNYDDFDFANDQNFSSNLPASDTRIMDDDFLPDHDHKAGQPLLVKLADLSKFGCSLNDINKSMMVFNHENQVWEGGDVDMAAFDEDARAKQAFADDDDNNWADDFELDSQPLPHSTAPISRPSNGGTHGPMLITPTGPLTLPKLNIDDASDSSSRMVFNALTQSWEGADVDLDGFDDDDESADDGRAADDNWDKYFDADDKTLKQQLSKGKHLTDFFSKIFRRGNGDNTGSLTSENMKKHKSKHPQRPILIKPGDINLSMFQTRPASVRSSTAISDELSAMDESDISSRVPEEEEDWNDGLEGNLDLDRISSLQNDDRLILMPLAGQRAPAFTQPSEPNGATPSTDTRPRASPPISLPSRPSSALTDKPRSANRASPQSQSAKASRQASTRVLITPEEAHVSLPVTNMTFDQEALTWKEKDGAPIDLDEEQKKATHKRGTPSGHDRHSLPQEFVVTEELYAHFLASEKKHNASMRYFLGVKDYQRMVKEGAYRLAKKSPLKHMDPQDSIKRCMEVLSDRKSQEASRTHRVTPSKTPVAPPIETRNLRPTSASSATSERSTRLTPTPAAKAAGSRPAPSKSTFSPRPQHKTVSHAPTPLPATPTAAPAATTTTTTATTAATTTTTTTAPDAQSAGSTSPVGPIQSARSESFRVSEIKMRVYKEMWEEAKEPKEPNRRRSTTDAL